MRKPKNKLAITSANKLKEQAEIDCERSVILLEKAEIYIQRVWADAYAKRNVPTYVFGAGNGDTPTGGDQEAQLLQQLLAMEYAKRLDYDRAIQK